MIKRLLLSFICLALMFSIAGCSGPTPDESVKNFFDALSKQDMETANSYLVNQNQKLGSDEILRLVYSGIKYEIVSSSINKDTAIVKAKVSVPDLAIIIENMYNDLFPQLVELALSDPEAIEAKSAQLAEEYFNKALSDPNTPMITSEVDIDLMKISSTKKWHIVGNSKLTSAIAGSFSTAMDKLNTAFSDTTSEESNDSYTTATPIGGEAQFSDGAITITKVEKSNGNAYASPRSGNEFIIATVRIKNTTNKQNGYSPAFFVLETYEGNFLQSIYSEVDSDTRLYMTQLKAGEEVEGTVVFEHNKYDPELYIHFTDITGKTALATFEVQQ